mmetsp:Transcript_16485/g.25434  ORF Transcript_16485/g.25434 Transcript_16485/m.25434 type:complete len:225 (-) Transcript_16485:35-709(-)
MEACTFHNRYHKRRRLRQWILFSRRSLCGTSMFRTLFRLQQECERHMMSNGRMLIHTQQRRLSPVVDMNEFLSLINVHFINVSDADHTRVWIVTRRQRICRVWFEDECVTIIDDAWNYGHRLHNLKLRLDVGRRVTQRNLSAHITLTHRVRHHLNRQSSRIHTVLLLRRLLMLLLVRLAIRHHHAIALAAAIDQRRCHDRHQSDHTRILNFPHDINIIKIVSKR